MAKTITQLPDATAVNAADEMIIQQSGITKRASISELKTEVAALGANNITVSGANRSITNTGNFALSFGTNNTERVRITESGVVGIYASGGEGGQLEFLNPSNAGTGMVIDVAGANVGRVFSGENNFQLVLGQLGSGATGGLITMHTASTERMRIDASGNVGIGTTGPNAAALLDVTSTTQGFLPPRMTTAQRDAISTPPAGLMVYNTSTNKLNVRTASSWEAVTSS